MRIPVYLRYVCKFGAHSDAFFGTQLAPNFDENPCAFRTILPLRAQSLIAQSSISDDNFSVQSDAAFDENPYAIVRFGDRHRNVNLTSWDVQFLQHDGRLSFK